MGGIQQLRVMMGLHPQMDPVDVAACRGQWTTRQQAASKLEWLFAHAVRLSQEGW